MIQITPNIALDPAELQETFIRASGPGGQNVNKVSTAVQLRLDLRAGSLPPALRARAERLAGARATKDGILIITAQSHRTQDRNRQDALDRLIDLLKQAAIRPQRRIATRPTLASKRRRTDAKTQRGATKRLRNTPEPD